MGKQFTVAAVFILALIVTSNAQSARNFAPDSQATGKRVAALTGAEATKAIARLGELSTAAIRERLQQLRRPDNLSSQLLVEKIVESHHLPAVSNKRVDQLKAALQPVLAYHGRSKMPIYVLGAELPNAYMVARAVVIITTRLMRIASDEEIRGIVAHELAHEYVWDERNRAMKANDGKVLRECELFCDAVAAFTLKEIGDDPASYRRILERMTMIGISDSNVYTWHGSATHPSLDTRKKLNAFLCQRLD